MTLNDEDRSQLIKHHIEKSKQAVESEADYDVLSDFAKDEIEKAYHDMNDLIAEIEVILEKRS